MTCLFCDLSIGNGETIVWFNAEPVHEGCWKKFSKKTGTKIFKVTCLCGNEIYSPNFVGLNSAANVFLIAVCRKCQRKVVACFDALEWAIRPP